MLVGDGSHFNLEKLCPSLIANNTLCTKLLEEGDSLEYLNMFQAHPVACLHTSVFCNNPVDKLADTISQWRESVNYQSMGFNSKTAKFHKIQLTSFREVLTIY